VAFPCKVSTTNNGSRDMCWAKFQCFHFIFADFRFWCFFIHPHRESKRIITVGLSKTSELRLGAASKGALLGADAFIFTSQNG